MQNYEFLDYRATPNDKYMLGLATVKAYGKLVLTFKHIKTKIGSAFFGMPSYTLGEGADKKYVQAVTIDSRHEEQALQDFIREHVMKYSTQSKPTSMDEVAHEQLPF